MGVFFDAKGNGGEYASRHLKYNDYLDERHRIEGKWVGKACEGVGVEVGGVVKDEAFRALSENRHAVTDEQVTVRHNGMRVVTDRQTGQPKVDPKTGKVEMESNRK